jgi:archaellum component FlaC
MKHYIMAVVTSLILVTIIFFSGPNRSISKIEKRVGTIEKNITALDTYNKSLASSINSTFSQINTYISLFKDQLSSSSQSEYAQQTAALSSLNVSLANQLSALQATIQLEAAQRTADLNSLKTEFNTISSSVSSLTTKVASLETTVAAIETTESDPDVTITSSDLEIVDGDKTFTGTVTVKVTNDTGSSTNNIILLFAFEADNDIPDVSSATLSGGSQTWYYEGQDDNILYFYNTTKTIDLSDGDYWKKTLTLYVHFSEAVTEDITFEASVSVQSYD